MGGAYLWLRIRSGDMFQFYHKPKPIKTLLPIISLCRMCFFLFHPLGMQPFGESWHLHTGVVSPVCLHGRARGSLLSSQQADIKPRLLSHKDWPVTPGKTLAIVFLILANLCFLPVSALRNSFASPSRWVSPCPAPPPHTHTYCSWNWDQKSSQHHFPLKASQAPYRSQRGTELSMQTM